MRRKINEPLYTEVRVITNGIPSPSNSKICEKEPLYNETSL